MSKIRWVGMSAVVVVAAATAFMLGRMTARPAVPEFMVRFEVKHGTVEFYQDGELTYELEPQDGEVYNELRAILLDQPAPNSTSQTPSIEFAAVDRSAPRAL